MHHNWEITAGRDVDWGQNCHWWVMTWIVNGTRKQACFTPLQVYIMSTGMIMLPYPPDHAIVWGDNTKTAGSAGDKMYYILSSNIWARMPLKVPEIPNVEMFFEKSPFPLTDAE